MPGRSRAKEECFRPATLTQMSEADFKVAMSGGDRLAAVPERRHITFADVTTRLMGDFAIITSRNDMLAATSSQAMSTPV